MEYEAIPVDGEDEELRLVLVGKTGSGKSASGNTILGRRHFLSLPSASSITRACQMGTAERTTRRVSVIDMPGFGDTHLREEQIHAEIAKCVALAAPGPHAFLLVVPIGRYTDSEHQAVCGLAKLFGENAVRHHTVVLFTRGDDLEGLEIDRYLRETAPDGLLSVIERCGGRYHVFNNRDPSSTQQVEELLMKVDNMARQTKEGFYTNAVFSEAEAAIREEQRRMVGERGKAEGQEQKENSGIKDRCGPAKRRMHNLKSDCFRAAQGTRRRRRDLQREGEEDFRVERSPEARGGRTSSLLSRIEAALSPSVLDRIKILVAALATGVAVGAVFGAAIPLAAATGASFAGTSVGLVAGVAGAANSVGAIVAAASGSTAMAVGASAGGFVGGCIGAFEGAEAASPREGASNALQQVSKVGTLAVGVATVAGFVLGAGAVLSQPAVSTPAVSGAESVSAVTAGAANVAGAQTGSASVVGQPVAAAPETTAQRVRNAAVGAVAGGLTFKMVKKTEGQRTGTRDSSYTEMTSYEFHLNR